MYIIFKANVHSTKKIITKVVIFQAGTKNISAKVWNRKCYANLTLAWRSPLGSTNQLSPVSDGRVSGSRQTGPKLGASKRSSGGDRREQQDDIPVGSLVLHQLLPVLPCPHRNHHPGGLVHGEPRYLSRLYCVDACWHCRMSLIHWLHHSA